MTAKVTSWLRLDRSGSVRDITDTITDTPFKDEENKEELPFLATATVNAGPDSRTPERELGRAAGLYQEGRGRFLKEKDYPAAIAVLDEALRSFLRAVELAPDDAEMLNNLGETLERIGIMYMNTMYLESAVGTFKKVVNLVPDNADSWAHIGVCLKDLGRTGESRFYFNRAREIRASGSDAPIGSSWNENQ